MGKSLLKTRKRLVATAHVIEHLKFVKPILLLSILIFTGISASRCPAQTAFHIPAPGSQERSAIFDSLRKPVQTALKQPVLFKVDHLRVQDSWAFYTGKVLQPNGETLNYKNTPYQEAIQAGVFDDWICALLQKKGDTWKVLIWQIGATDVPYVTWPQEFKAPASIFPK
jgi:hypothetical protein